MTRTLGLTWMICALLACGGDEALGGSGGGDGDGDAGDGAESGGDDGGADGGAGPLELPAPDGWRRLALADRGEASVAGLGTDGALVYAYLDERGRPVVGGGVRPPEVPGSASAVGLIANDDGVHLVWDPAGAIVYARRDPNGDWSEPVALDDALGREPTMAQTPAGEIVVAYTQDRITEVGEDSVIVIHRGSASGFGAAQVVNEGCCLEANGFPFDMSGPSLAIGPDDSVHVLYEWGVGAGATIEYLTDRSGEFESIRLVDNAAFFPCPALVVDEGGAHITYVLEPNTAVWYLDIVDGAPTPAEPIVEADAVTLALLAKGDRGLVVAATVVDASGTSLVARVLADPEPEVLLSDEPGIALSPTAGGAFAGDGRVGFAYARGTGEFEPLIPEVVVQDR